MYRCRRRYLVKTFIIDGMSGSTIFSTVDVRDGFYRILMRKSDVPLTAVSTVASPAIGAHECAGDFQEMRHTSVAPRSRSYFDDVFVHCPAEDGRSDVEVHRIHLDRVLALMRNHKLYANLKECIFGAPEIPVLGCFIGKDDVRPDPQKIKAIFEWPTPRSSSSSDLQRICINTFIQGPFAPFSAPEKARWLGMVCRQLVLFRLDRAQPDRGSHLGNRESQQTILCGL